MAENLSQFPQFPEMTEPSLSLHHTRLLVGLDALLRMGSVSAAAKSLDMHASAMSRLLTELRKHYQDDMFVRTGRGMTPTPFAESLRQKVRSLVTEMEGAIGIASKPAGTPIPAYDHGWRGKTAFPLVPLALRNGNGLDAAPSPKGIAERIAAIDKENDPVRRLAKFIAIAGPGPGRSRSLTSDEAEKAFDIILSGEADPIQIGALIMPLQYRGVTSGELAGMVLATRRAFDGASDQSFQPDLDWPAYVSASWRQPPWFLLSAKLVASSGTKILLHGYHGNGEESGKLELAANDCGIAVCHSLQEAANKCDLNNIAYLPMGAFAAKLQSLLGLYPLFETRTPFQLVPHLLDPLNARATLLGAAQISRRDLYRHVAHLLEQRELTIVGSNRDFAQVNPEKATTLYRITSGEDRDDILPALGALHSSGSVSQMTQREYWIGVWTGAVVDAKASASIIHTAAVALLTADQSGNLSLHDAIDKAHQLWMDRDMRVL